MEDGHSSGPLLPASRWRYLNSILSKPGPFTDPDWMPQMLLDAKILVIGAGGLGCEILKDLALSGFKDIHVIDMDTIDVSNLNRQFLFRQTDVGKPKATVAAKFVEKRVKGVKITPYYGKIQDKDDDYYMQFFMVICGLDSIDARKWINRKLIELVKDNPDNPQALKPLVDGGTEGFKGQARVVYPTMTSCIECQLDLHAPRPQVPLCTIATIPRQPQHCIEWAHQIAWAAQRGGESLDTDDPDHIMWLYTQALARAEEFGISGVTYSMTQGVVKNIIPAIASTNAIIAAACCNEALKIITGAAPALGFPETPNYMMFTGDDSIYTHTFEHQRKEDCPECGTVKSLLVECGWTLQDLLHYFAQDDENKFENPTLSSGDGPIYFSAPPSLFESTRPNLKRKLGDLLADGEELAVTDPAYQTQFRFKLSFREKK